MMQKYYIEVFTNYNRVIYSNSIIITAPNSGDFILSYNMDDKFSRIDSTRLVFKFIYKTDNYLLNSANKLK